MYSLAGVGVVELTPTDLQPDGIAFNADPLYPVDPSGGSAGPVTSEPDPTALTPSTINTAGPVPVTPFTVAPVTVDPTTIPQQLPTLTAVASPAGLPWWLWALVAVAAVGLAKGGGRGGRSW